MNRRIFAVLLVSAAFVFSPPTLSARPPEKSYDINKNPLPMRQFGLLFKYGYTVKGDGTVWGPKDSKAISVEDMPYRIDHLISSERLKVLLELNIILSRGPGRKPSAEDKKKIRSIVRKNWDILSVSARNDFKVFFVLQELEEMNAQAPIPFIALPPQPLDSIAPLTRTPEREPPLTAKPPRRAARKKKSPVLKVSRFKKPELYPVDIGAPLMKPPIIKKTPVKAAKTSAPVKNIRPLPIDPIAPLMKPLALARVPAKAPVRKSKPLIRRPQPPLSGPKITAAQPPETSATAPARGTSNLPQGMKPKKKKGLYKVIFPKAKPKITEPVNPGPKTSTVSYRTFWDTNSKLMEQPEPEPVWTIPKKILPGYKPPPPRFPAPVFGADARTAPAQFGVFLKKAPYDRTVRTLLRLIAEKAMDPFRSQALGLVLEKLPNIVIDGKRTGRGLRSASTRADEDSPEGAVFLSPGPIIFTRKGFLFGSSQILLSASPQAYTSLNIPPPDLMALDRGAGPVDRMDSKWGKARSYKDRSLNGTYSTEQMAGSLLRELLSAVMAKSGAAASPYAVEIYTRTAQFAFYLRLSQEQDSDDFLDPHLRGVFRQWKNDPLEWRDHQIHTLSGGISRRLDPARLGTEARAASNRRLSADCRVLAKAESDRRFALAKNGRLKEIRALKDSKLLDKKTAKKAAARIEGSLDRPSPEGICDGLEDEIGGLINARVFTRHALRFENRLRLEIDL